MQCMKTRARLFPVVEILEDRIAPATHEWTGGGANNLWSNAANWTNGSPATDASGNIDLVFHTNLTNAAQLVMQNDINNLLVDSMTFDANAGTGATGGTSANGYTINGNLIFINATAAGQDPFGIDVGPGVADATNGITETFNTPLTLFGFDATFRTQQNGSRLTFHGDIDLALKTLTINNAGINSSAIQSVVFDGDFLGNGNLIKTGGGTLQLSGDNTVVDTTLNNGVVVATSNLALGGSAGTITVNDPGQILLRNGVTIQKTTLNLNSNQLGGGLGADGNTTNTFRGAMVLMAGSGGVALGAGVGAANASTRLIIDGVISGATSTLSLNGAGVIEFTKDNTYTGLTNHNGNNGFGALQIDSPGGLGASGAGNGTQLNRNGAGPTGSALWLNFDGTTNETVQFAGSGVGGLGAIRALGDSAPVITGNITLIAGAPWHIGVDSGSLTLTGAIDSQGANRGLTKIGAGRLTIGGTAANTYVGGTVVNAGLLSVKNTSATPLGSAASSVTVNGGTTLRLESGVNAANSVLLNAGGTLIGTGAIGSLVSDDATVSPGGTIATGNVTLDANSTFVADINGAGSGLHDQLSVNGTVDLAGARLSLAGGFLATPGTVVTLIDNDGAEAVTGKFAGLDEGARIGLGGQVFTLSYAGGTNANDVVLIAVPAISDFAIAANGLSATYTDVDGDKVTVKITKGALTASDFTLGFAADNRQQLQLLTLDAADAGTNLSITAKRTKAGGDGFVNVGFINATGVALGTVTISGDLGRINAAAIKSLTVKSFGALGTTTQAAGGSLTSNFSDILSKLTVKSSIRDATLIGTTSIGTVKIGGSFIGGRISAGADLGAVSVRGDIVGTAASPVIISAFGLATAPTTGPDTAIKSLTVTGGVEFLRVLAGYDTALAAKNADASIGAISVGKDWRSSTVLAGVVAGTDTFVGTADDKKLTGGTRDAAALFSTIASVTIKGQALGTTTNGDTFGIVAEQITKAKVGKVVLTLDPGERDAADAFALGSTGPGATGLPSDFFLREVTL